MSTYKIVVLELIFGESPAMSSHASFSLEEHYHACYHVEYLYRHSLIRRCYFIDGMPMNIGSYRGYQCHPVIEP
jgi:hypothetical protein